MVSPLAPLVCRRLVLSPTFLYSGPSLGSPGLPQVGAVTDLPVLGVGALTDLPVLGVGALTDLPVLGVGAVTEAEEARGLVRPPTPLSAQGLSAQGLHHLFRAPHLLCSRSLPLIQILKCAADAQGQFNSHEA